jgi:hypothetical protein
MTAYPIIAWIIGQRSRCTEIPNALRRIARTIRSRRRSSRRPRRRHGHHPHANTPHRCPGNRRDEGWHRGIHLQGNKSSDTKKQRTDQMAQLTTVEDEFEDELKNSCFKSSYISGFSTVESLATTSSSSDSSRSLVGGGRSQ